MRAIVATRAAVVGVLLTAAGACDAPRNTPGSGPPARQPAGDTVNASVQHTEWRVVPEVKRVAEPATWIRELVAVDESTLAGLDRHGSQLIAWDLRDNGPGQVVAREGAGPGELRCPSNVTVQAEGYVVLDSCGVGVKFIGLDPGGGERWRRRVDWGMASPLSASGIARTHDGWLVAAHGIPDISEAVDGEVLVPSRLERLHQVGEKLVPAAPLVETRMRWRNVGEAQRPFWMPFKWSPVLRWAMHPGGEFVVAYHDSSYHLEQIPIEGGERRRIGIAGGARPTTRAERDSLVRYGLSNPPTFAPPRPDATVPVSPMRAPVAGLRFAPDGVLWVKYVGTVDRGIHAEGGTVVDRVTFAGDAVSVERGTLPCYPDAFLDPRRFACVENPDPDAPVERAVQAPIIRVYAIVR